MENVKWRHCRVFKVEGGKWYMTLAPEDRMLKEHSDCYGPFQSDDDALLFLDSNFANPGSYVWGLFGRDPVPEAAPNGSPIINPVEENR